MAGAGGLAAVGGSLHVGAPPKAVEPGAVVRVWNSRMRTFF